MATWDTTAAATWNRHLSALISCTTWAQRQDLLATNPARRLLCRKTPQRGDRAIPAVRLEKLFTDDRHPLRERVLWRLLYETAARAEEILPLDVEDLDLEFRCARVRSKGGAIEYVHRATATARLLPRLLAGRTAEHDPAARRGRRRTRTSQARGVFLACSGRTPSPAGGRLSLPATPLHPAAAASDATTFARFGAGAGRADRGVDAAEATVASCPCLASWGRGEMPWS
ncbi:tyrosine-type recombinase/integrase [Nonomuraea sp. NPDC003560]|uniref:tyrosine-type recombinase/integrase n=1 Tax=Nonomuraea sp. NPDC003560 TaxID=3364341 RepID=UPI0036BFB6EB